MEGKTSAAFLTTQQVASHMGVTKQTVRNMCESGQLRAVRIGKVWRINRAAFEFTYGQVREPDGDLPAQGDVAALDGNQLTADERRVIELWRRCDDRGRKTVLMTLESQFGTWRGGLRLAR